MTIKVPCSSRTLTTTVTTGVIADSISCDITAVEDWARYSGLFEEYIIMKVDMIVNCFSSSNPGIFRCWFDEKSSAAPTASQAKQEGVMTFACADVFRPHVLTWRARDFADLDYVATSSTFTPVYFKTYTNNADYGSSAVATPYASIALVFSVRFRGFSL